MLRKKEAFTTVTPIPSFIPRQLALDILHSHSEVINVNPLVLEHKAIPAPRNAAADEFYSTWYEIVERIQYVPGVGKMGSGRISFTGCFHDMPWGLQTHMYCPMNIEMRNRYRIAGNQPGVEPPEHREIGLESLGAPSDGLYLREDIEIKCNITLASFVKAQTKAASKAMVQRIIKKAELLDSGALQAMVQDGKLKTVNPNDRSAGGPSQMDRINVHSPGGLHQAHMPDNGNPPGSPSMSHRHSMYGSSAYSPYPRPETGSPQPYSPQALYRTPTGHGQYHPPPPPIPPKEDHAPMELPGDYQYLHPLQQHQQAQQPITNPAHNWQRDSVGSSDPRWSQSHPSPSLPDTQRTSMSSVASTSGGQPSPAFARQGFASELSAHDETTEEHHRRHG